MTNLDSVRAYRERLLDLVVNRSDVRMDGAVQYVPRGKETLEIFDAALAELKAENEALRLEVEDYRSVLYHIAANEEALPHEVFSIWAQNCAMDALSRRTERGAS